MKYQEKKKKVWVKPEVHILNIKKDTFSGGSISGPEVDGKTGLPPIKF